MRYQTLGRAGLRVSDLFLGAMTFGDDWGWGAPPEECRRMIDAYAEAGGNVIDTANIYTNGSSERILGELLGADRDHFVLATKYTVTMSADINGGGNHRRNLRRSLEQSLDRLRTDHIDLYWVHIWDQDTPLEETMRALDDAVRAGKILYVGISDAPAWVVARANTLAEWRDWSPFVGLQLQYSLLERNIERELLPMADALNLSVAAWAPLARGILSGKFTRTTDTPRQTRAGEVTDEQLTVARAVDAVADDLGVTSSQVAIAWTRAWGRRVHPILGARTLDQLTDNLGAATLDLPADAIRRLNEASPLNLGFPYDFLDQSREFVYGAADRSFDRHGNT